MKFKKVKDKVASLLRKYLKLRNDDRELIFAYWETFDHANLKIPKHSITSPATIIRHRAKLQAEGQFLPTDPKVAKKRLKHRRKIEAELGYA